MKNVIICIIFLFSLAAHAQLKQTHRFEIEKKNTDDFFTVLPAAEQGVIIIRDVNDKERGDVWQLTALDTALCENWQIELNIDIKYFFKGYDLTAGKVYLLFREGELERNDYQIIEIAIESGEVERYDIKNELPLELTHLAVLSDRMVLGGQVNLSPTLVTYKFGDESFEVIPGFFKDRSIVVDLRDNGNETFNAITIEKDYLGDFLRLRTYSYDGVILFEKEIKSGDDRYRILGARSSGFIDGNIVIAGTYSINNSYYAVGMYLAVVKPLGQDNVMEHIPFYQLAHFFDYMRPKRAARIQAKLKKRLAKGKEFNYSTKLMLHEVRKYQDGYLLTAELFDPDYVTPPSPAMTGNLDNREQMMRRQRAYQSYTRQPSRLQNVDDADSFEYLQAVVCKLDKNGKLEWDNSMKIEDVETLSLEQVTQVKEIGENLAMVYRTDENIFFKSIYRGDSVVASDTIPLMLTYEYDKLFDTYDGVNKCEDWYDNNFFVWGYHKIENKVDTVDRRRSVLYVNKMKYE